MKALYSLHAFLRRHLTWLERLLVAWGFTILLAELLSARPVYPIYWDTVLLTGVFLLLLFWPTWGYFAALAIALYPLGEISIYLAVLVLAIALLGQHWFIPNLGLVLLVAGAPFLNGIYLAWLVPLLGGLWWGPRAGLLAGASGALWGKILFGLLGLPPDWLSLSGLYPDLAPTLLRFEGLTSWQVLEVLTAPLVANSTATLYHLLQTIIWAFTGWLIGYLALQDRVQYNRPRSTLTIIIGGVFLMSILQSLLSWWIGTANPTEALLDNLLPNALLTLFVAGLFELFAFFVEYPWNPPQTVSAEFHSPAKSIERESSHPSAPPTPAANTPNTPPHSKTDKDEDSLIMIELD